MKARDVMAFPVITVKPNFSVEEVAKTFVQRRISGAPVVDDAGKLVGVISEGDLMFRSEIGTARPHPYWYLEYAPKEHLAEEYVKGKRCSGPTFRIDAGSVSLRSDLDR